jgi:hypothetical protein
MMFNGMFDCARAMQAPVATRKITARMRITRGLDPFIGNSPPQI